MKLKIKTKDCRLNIRIKTSRNEVLDTKELDRFSRVFLRGFLRPKIDGKKVEYTGPIGISLFERLKKPITKRDFYFIVEQVVVSIQKLKANNFSIDNLITSTNYVFINEVTKEVQFLYIPLMPANSECDVYEFIQNIVYSVTPSDEKDTDFISRFVYYINGLKEFDVDAIEKYILKEDRSVVNTIKKHNMGQSGFMTSSHQHYHEHYDEENSETGENKDSNPQVTVDKSEDEELTTVLTEDDSEENTTVLVEDEETSLLTEDEEGTALLEEIEETPKFPTLYRVLTEETISVNKPIFRLGKEKSYVDYFVTNNIAVSRSHADIISRNDKFYVKDLNSKNHTFINDQLIPAMVEIEIKDGNKLRLGNEEFIFNV